MGVFGPAPAVRQAKRVVLKFYRKDNQGVDLCPWAHPVPGPHGRGGSRGRLFTPDSCCDLRSLPGGSLPLPVPRTLSETV